MTETNHEIAWYLTERVVMTDEKKKWPFIRRWQLAGLVSVRPINRTSARSYRPTPGASASKRGEG